MITLQSVKQKQMSLLEYVRRKEVFDVNVDNLIFQWYKRWPYTLEVDG